MDDPAADTEQDAIRRFLALREGLRSQGLTTEVEAIKDWLPQVRDPRMIGEMAKLLGFYWLRRGRYAEAIEFSERAAATLLDADVAYNVIFAQFQSQRWDDVVARAKQALEIHPATSSSATFSARRWAPSIVSTRHMNMAPDRYI